MKVLLLCMAFAAVSLAMPVAEEKQEVPVAPPSIPEIKPEDSKVQSELKTAPVENEKLEKEPEAKTAELLPEEAAKSASAPVDIVPETKSAINTEIAPEVTKENIPEGKAAVPEATLKTEVPEPSQVKPEVKSDLPESKPVVEELKSEGTPAKVEELKNEQPLAKSVITDDVIDVDSAFDQNVAVADDVVDPAAINPAIATKTADPEEKIAESPAQPEVKASKPEEIKPEEPKTEEKPAEVIPVSDTSASAKSAPVSDARVVRDATEEKQEAEAPKIEAKTIKDEVKPADEPKIELKSAKPEEILIANDKESESQSQEVSNESAVKSSEVTIEKVKETVIPIQPAEVIAAKSATKPQDEILNDQPANKSSEESRESPEKIENNSSEESGESKESKP